MSKDTNGNGIIDKDEKTMQEFEQKIDDDTNQLDKVIIKLNATGYLQNNSEIKNMKGIYVYSDKVTGLIGVPVEIRTFSDFEEATIEFTYNKLPKGTNPDDLGVLWYNEEEGLYEIQKSELNKDKKTVTIKTTHFSTYLLINLSKWKDVWNKEIDYTKQSKEIPNVDICFLLDNSKSMNKKALDKAKNSIASFITNHSDKGKLSIVSYDAYSSKTEAKLGSSKKVLLDTLKNLNISTKTVKAGDTTTKGLEEAIAQLNSGNKSNNKIIILFCDDDMKSNQQIIDSAVNNSVRLFVCNITNKNDMKNLRKMITKLGGYYYNAEESGKMLLSIQNAYNIIKAGIDLKDTDGDGYSDGYEEYEPITDISTTRGSTTEIRSIDNKPKKNEVIRGFDELMQLSLKYGKENGVH